MREGDSVAFVLAGKPARVALGRTTDLSLARQTLKELAPSDRSTDLASAVTLARSSLRSSTRATSRLVVLSDFAATAPAAGEPALWAPLPELARPLPDCGIASAERRESRVSATLACTGPDAARGRRIALKAGSVSLGQVALVLSTRDELNTTYNGVEFKAEQRFRSGANLFGGATIGRARGSVRGSNDDLNNPNVLINSIGATGFDSTYQYKVAGSYPLPFGIGLSGALQVATGLPLSRVFTVTRTQVPNLTQVTQSVDLVPAGEVRLPSHQLLDLRISGAVIAPYFAEVVANSR